MRDYSSLDLQSPFRGATAWYVPVTASTMEDARILSARSACGLVVAGEQTLGRGRLPGRSWLSAPGESLLVTLWFPASAVAAVPLPLVAGLAALRACEAWAGERGASFRAPLAIKWPNDLLAGGRKLAGILCEASGDSAYLGLGLNRSQAAFEEGYRSEPGSLLLETGVAPAGLEPLGEFLAALAPLLDGREDWLPALNARLAGRGRPARFSPGLGEGEPLEGILEGVAADGALLLRGAGGTTAWRSGELRITAD